MNQSRKAAYELVIKPALDITFSIISLILLSPLWILIIIILLIANRGKVFFIQSRPGKNGRIFKILKFKTMNDKKDESGNLLDDKDRLTSIGKFIRKASIDEVPQLVNVIKGDMSLIGPRPLLVEYLTLYNDYQRRRQEVKPGITGWAQIKGRNALSWEKKFEYDVWYVDNVGFLIDLKILWMTVKKVFISEGIGSGTSLTMEKFTGDK